jgi:4-hydroxybenzoate polyprenyltransferase
LIISIVIWRNLLSGLTKVVHWLSKLKAYFCRVVLGSFLAFTLFCCASSGFYLINDIADVESDRQHPVKCKRPIAAGLVNIRVASAIALVLLGGALIWSLD